MKHPAIELTVCDRIDKGNKRTGVIGNPLFDIPVTVKRYRLRDTSFRSIRLPVNVYSIIMRERVCVCNITQHISVANTISCVF